MYNISMSDKIYLHGLYFGQPYIVSYEVEKLIKHYKVVGKREVVLGEVAPRHTLINANSDNITASEIGAKIGLRNLLKRKQHEFSRKENHFIELQEEIKKLINNIDPEEENERLFG